MAYVVGVERRAQKQIARLSTEDRVGRPFKLSLKNRVRRVAAD